MGLAGHLPAQLLRLGLMMFIVALGAIAYAHIVRTNGLDPVDSMAYYNGVYGPYGVLSPEGWGYYQYSPAFLQAITPLRALEPAVFVLTWSLVLVAAYALAMRWVFPLVLLTSWVTIDIVVGNIYGLMLLAVVLGFRYPATWSFLILTKVTPGVGVLWFAFRREWRSFGIALGVTAAIVAVSFVIDPGLWRQWFETLASNAAAGVPDTTQGAIRIPLVPRLVAAVGLVWLAARLDRRWIVAVAVLVALPSLQTISPIMLLAIIPLALEDRRAASARSGNQIPAARPPPTLACAG